MRAQRLVVGLALAVTTAALLTGCAFAPPATRSSDPALADSLAQIDGVQDAVAAPSSDGSPTAKRLTLRIYLDEPATADLSTITTDSSKLAWNFRGFTQWPMCCRSEMGCGSPFRTTTRSVLTSERCFRRSTCPTHGPIGQSLPHDR